MTEVQISQARSIEFRQRNLEDILKRIKKSMDWYGKYPKLYDVVIVELKCQQADIETGLANLRKQLADLWLP